MDPTQEMVEALLRQKQAQMAPPIPMPQPDPRGPMGLGVPGAPPSMQAPPPMAPPQPPPAPQDMSVYKTYLQPPPPQGMAGPFQDWLKDGPSSTNLDDRRVMDTNTNPFLRKAYGAFNGKGYLNEKDYNKAVVDRDKKRFQERLPQMKNIEDLLKKVK